VARELKGYVRAELQEYRVDWRDEDGESILLKLIGRGHIVRFH